MGEKQFYLRWDANDTVEGRLHGLAGEDNGRIFVLCCMSWADAGETVREMNYGLSLRGEEECNGFEHFYIHFARK